MDNHQPWWAFLLTWGFWGPVLGGIVALIGVIAATLFLLDGDRNGLLWVICALLAVIVFLLASSKR